MSRYAPLLLLLLLPWTTPSATAGEEATEDGWLRDRVIRYAADEASLRSFYGEPLSEFRLERLARFLARWRGALEGMKAPSGVDAAIDRRLLINHIDRRGDERRLQRARNAETLKLMPFAPRLLELEAARRRSEPVEAKAVAKVLDDVRLAVGRTQKLVEQGLATKPAPKSLRTTKVIAFRAAKTLGRLRSMLRAWFSYRDGFEPTFSWWVKKPYDALAKAISGYETFLREKVAGVSSKKGAAPPLLGDPLGRDALCRALQREMVPYTPEQLLVIARREFAWCEAEGKKASKELGLDGTWPAAVAHVKTLHKAPGEQDDLVAAQAREAIDFLEKRDLVTVPPIAAETWRLKMLSERDQKTLPFAVYNDQHMLVAYATGGMEHGTKIQAMRGNNEHFTRIVTPPSSSPGTTCSCSWRPGIASIVSCSAHPSSSRAGRCTGRCSSGTSAGTAGRRIASACSSGACIAAHGSLSRSRSISGR